MYYNHLSSPIGACTAGVTDTQIMTGKSSSGSEEDTPSTCSSDYETADEGETADKAISLPVVTCSTQPLPHPSLEDCFSDAGIPVDCAILDKIITSEEHIADIAKELTQWKDLFPYLGLKGYCREEIEAAGDLSEQKRKLLTIWTQKLGHQATYRHLCTILYQQRRMDLVALVCEVVKSVTLTPVLQPSSHSLPTSTAASSHSRLQSIPQPPPPSHHLPLTPSQPPLSAVDSYHSHLRAVYTRSEIPDSKWPPSPGKKYINLAVMPKESTTHQEADKSTIATLRGDVDLILKGKSPIQLEDIFTVEAGEPLKCTLVEGAPGMGKSTLAWHVCQQWGKGEFFQQFSIVQLLQLRDARVQAATCVEDIFPHYDKKLQSEVVQEISKSHGEGTLIILDGLDELPGQLLSQSSIFTGLLSGEILPRATIMITSRHSATDKLWKNWKQQISRHIEIIGFTENNIAEYVNSVLPPQELPQFQNYLSIHPHIERMMYVPLHCAIVTIVYSECQKSRKPPPRTLTGLYTCLAQTILIRYLNDHPDYKGEEYCLDCFSNLPPPVYEDFKKLCKVAFDGIEERKLIICDLPQGFNHLGFMAAVPELTLYRQSPNYSHNFLHLSVQEFLAAYHVSLMTIPEQEQLLQISTRTITSFEAGLVNFKNLNKAVVRKSIGIDNEVDSGTMELDNHIFEILYESQDVRSILEDECHYAVAIFPLWAFEYSLYHDYVALGYSIANSFSKWTLNSPWKKYCSEARSDYSETGFAGLRAFADQLKKSKTFSIEKLVLQPDTPPEALKIILSGISSVKTLTMFGLDFTLLSTKVVASMLQQKLSVTSLEVRDCDNDCMCCLARALRSNTTVRVLKWTAEVSYKFYSRPVLIDETGALAIADMLNYNKTVTLLTLSGELGVRGALAMTKMLQHNTTLTEINMSGISVEEEGALPLAEVRSLDFQSVLKKAKLYPDDLAERGALATSVNSVSKERALVVAEELKRNTTLTVLTMSGNSVGDERALAMAETLRQNTTLTVLDIREMSVSDEGSLAMAELLKENSTLTVLNMSGIAIGDEGALAMVEALKQNTTLMILNMSGISVDDEGALAMAEALKQNTALTELNLSDNPISNVGVMAVAEALGQNTVLTELVMSGISVGDEGVLAIAEALKQNTTLTKLKIHANSIGDDGIMAIAETLKHNLTLTELNMSDYPIGGEGVMAMAETLNHNTTLTILNMSGISVSDEGVLAIAEALKQNTTLTQLKICANSISDDGIMAIAATLRQNSVLTELYIIDSSISDEGVTALAEALKQNTVLTVLYICDNSISDEGIIAVAEALKQNTKLTVLDMREISDGIEGVLAIAEVLKQNTTLEWLCMSRISVSDEGILAMAEALKQNTTLVCLYLRGISVGDEGALAMAEALKLNTTLRKLEICDNSLAVEGVMAIAEALKQNKTLIELFMGNNSIGDEGALAIAEALKLNTTLTVLGMSAISVGNEGALAIAEVLKQSTTLTVLDMCGIPVSDEGALAMAKALKNNTTLTELDMRGVSVDNKGALAIVESLKHNWMLTVLDMSRISVSDEGALAMAEALKVNRTLRVLRLSDTSIGDKGVLAMAEVLKQNTTLEWLNMNGNTLGGEGALAMAEVLKQNTTLTVLDICWISVSNKGALAMAEALNENTTLEIMSIHGISIGDEGTLAMAEALKQNTTLTELIMSEMSIGIEGVLAIAEALQQNSTLTILRIDGMSVGDEGAKAMAQTLRQNMTLTVLDLLGISVGDKGALALAEALKQNSTLTILNMSGISVCDEGALALAEALKQNSTLTILNMSGISVCDEGALAMAETLKQTQH